MTKEELKELVKEKGSKTLCKERIAKSKSVQKTCDYISFKAVNAKADTGVKADKQTDEGVLDVEVIANMAMFSDSDNDVLTKNSWAKSIEQRGQGDIIPFLKDHIHSTRGIIGRTIEFRDQKVDLSMFGYIGQGDALVHQAQAIKSIDKETYNKYLEGLIKQHSIGLQYIHLFLAINDKDYEEEYKVWQSNIDNIINVDKVQDDGYFWLVTEIKLVENSAVLFGANPLTSTLSVQPSSDTGKSSKNKSKNFYFNLIRK